MAQKTMYPPQKDSPRTFLLGDISAIDTFIVVGNAAALPQALPYPLTIGVDKTVTETVMVTVQNLENNQLTVTRGTPAYAWVAGSMVARVLTAKDFEDVQDNIRDLDTNMTSAQDTLATQGTDISTLKTTVGNSSSGLVKGLADEIARATDAETAEATRASNAESTLNTNKVNRSELAQVITDWSYSADGTKLQLTITRYNSSTQQTSQYTKNMPIVTEEAMGVMTPEAYAEISALRTDVDALINLGGRFIGVSFATKAALDAYSVPSTVNTGDFTYVLDDETHSGATTRYVRNGAVWNFTFVIDYDPIGLATSATAGIVKSDSGSTNGKVFVETDGTMSVVGWDAAITDIANLKTTVGDATSGLVKELADETARAAAAEGSLNTNKITRSELTQVITDWSYSADGTKVQLTINCYNSSTKQAAQITKTIPVVTDDTMGVMTPEAYAEITALRTDVDALINLGGKFIGTSFATKAALDAYSVPSTVKTGDFTYILDDETHSGSTTRYVRNESTWDFTFVIEYDPVGLATTSTAGLVKSKSGVNGKVFVETDGTMSVIGWDSLSSGITLTATVSTDWLDNASGGYYQTVTVVGMLSTDNPIVDVVLNDDVDESVELLKAWSKVDRITTGNGTVTVYCFSDAPEISIPMQFKIVR